MRQVTFGDFAKRAKQRHWSAESLAANVSRQNRSPVRILPSRSERRGTVDSDCLSVGIELYESESTVTDMSTASGKAVCACGCGAPVFDRKKWATPGCKNRVQRRAA